MGKRAAGPSNSQATSKKKAAADSSAVDGFREAAKTLRDAHQTKIRADLETELEKVPHLWAELLEMLRNKTLEHRANSEEEDDDDLPQRVEQEASYVFLVLDALGGAFLCIVLQEVVGAETVVEDARGGAGFPSTRHLSSCIRSHPRHSELLVFLVGEERG